MKISPSGMVAQDGAASNVFLSKASFTKRNVVIGLIILLAVIAIPAAMYLADIKGAAVFIGAAIAPLFIFAIIAYPRVGVITLLVLAYLLYALMKLELGIPLGTVVDGINVLLLFGIFLHQRRYKDWSMFKSPITGVIIAWMVYNLIEFLNPTAVSQMAWLYTVRSVAFVMVTYFIFVYNIRSRDFVKIVIKLWIGLAIAGALYGLKQEFIGFTDAEMAWLQSDPAIANLLFIDGHWRRFSFFADPVAFSYNMVAASLLCIGLLFGPYSIGKKIALACCAGLFLFAMVFSGTRGAYVLVPAAVSMIALLKFNRTVLIAAAIGAVFLVGLIMVPTSNTTIYRFQSAFRPSDDASFNLRKHNQKRIQPFIQSHPMGGGLGATGVWGTRFAPKSFLANFPPDSGYVRVAVEMGWIGLFLFCLLMFTILKTGINNYYRIKDPELKAVCMAMVLVIFAYNVGNYPQEALVQFPSNIYFYLATALITISYQLDRKEEYRTNIKNS